MFAVSVFLIRHRTRGSAQLNRGVYSLPASSHNVVQVTTEQLLAHFVSEAIKSGYLKEVWKY